MADSRNAVGCQRSLRNGQSSYRETRKASRALDRLELADSDDDAQARKPQPQQSAPASSAASAAYSLKSRSTLDTLPVGLSVFCNRRLFTREIIFNLKRLDSLKTIKTLVNTYFAYEFKRIGLPREVYFAGLHCVLPPLR